MSDRTLRIEGLAAFEATCARVGEVDQVFDGVLYRHGERVMGMSKPLVPWEFGILRDSGYVSLPFEGPDQSRRVEIGYGGAAAAYAVVQHEDLTLNHPRGGQAKYLEEPVVQSQDAFLSDASDAYAAHCTEAAR